MVRAKEYCEKTTSYLWNGKGESTFLVLDGCVPTSDNVALSLLFCAVATLRQLIFFRRAPIVPAELLLPSLRGAAAAP